MSFDAAGERLLVLTKQALQGVLTLNADQQTRLKALGARVAEIQLLALTDPTRAGIAWPILEASIEQWKQVALGRSEAARLRMRSAVLEFLNSAVEIASKIAGKVF